MVRLASIEFTKLKSIRAGTRLTFPESGAVLLGKNGTGKTTLLRYIVALCAADTTAFVTEEPFDVAAMFRFRSGASARLRLQGIPDSGSTLPLETSTQITRYLPTGESIRLEYQIMLSDQHTEYRIIIADGRVELYHENQSLSAPLPVASSQYQLGSCVLRLADLVASSQRQPLSAIAAELIQLQGALCRYDEGLDYFRLLTDEDSSYLSLKTSLSANDTFEIPPMAGNIDRYPFDLLIALVRSRDLKFNSEFFSAGNTEIEFLSDFIRLCGFSTGRVIAPIESRHAVRDNISYELKSLRFAFELGQDKISHTRLSFGQKRLLSYLYYLGCNTQIGIADELVNGMHHEWIEYCLTTACQDRQMFYTSQNPLLLDFLGFESETEVFERFVTCKWHEQDGFVWENLDPRIGSEFYRLYKTGIQHVSDILRTKGWW